MLGAHCKHELSDLVDLDAGRDVPLSVGQAHDRGARRRSGYLAAAIALARVLDGGFGFALIRIARPSG
jgi:hypothetical protein